MTLVLYCSKHYTRAKSSPKHRCTVQDSNYNQCGKLLKRLCTLCYIQVAHGTANNAHKCGKTPSVVPSVVLSFIDWYKTAIGYRRLSNATGTVCQLNATLRLIYHSPVLLSAIFQDRDPHPLSVGSLVRDALQELNRVNSESSFEPTALHTRLTHEVDTDEYGYSDAAEILDVMLRETGLSLAPTEVMGTVKHPGVIHVTESLACKECNHSKTNIDTNVTAYVIASDLLQSKQTLPQYFLFKDPGIDRDRELNCSRGGCPSKFSVLQHTTVLLERAVIFHLKWQDPVNQDNGLAEFSWLVDTFEHEGHEYRLDGMVIFHPGSTQGNGKNTVDLPPHYYTLARTCMSGHMIPPVSSRPSAVPWLSIPNHVHELLSTRSSPYAVLPNDWVKLDDENDALRWSDFAGVVKGIPVGDFPMLLVYHRE